LSAKGRTSRSPLVPDYADAEPDKPLPEPVGQRFRSFRAEFGRAVAGAGTGSFARALRHYAREATGGVTVGPRRFGTAYTAGGNLFGLVTDLQAGGNGEAIAGVDVSRLVGQPLGIAAQEIARALAPPNADQDVIRIAIQEAMVEALPDMDVFDPAALTADDLIALLIEFFTRILFQEITSDAGDAWNKADTPERTIDAENELMDLIHATVDRHLAPELADGIDQLSRQGVEGILRRATDEIWREWAGSE
jgi:hypothetical protein